MMQFGPAPSGESLTITTRAEIPGVFMYHCAAGPVTDDHIKSGLRGAMIVYPRDQPLRPARELVIVEDAIFGEPDEEGVIPGTDPALVTMRPSVRTFRPTECHLAAARSSNSGYQRQACTAWRPRVPSPAGDVAGLPIRWANPDLAAAIERTRSRQLEPRFVVVLAPMDCLPLRDRSCDLIVAHGIWNLARSAIECRGAIREARVATPGAALFVFTCSRNTLPPETLPVPGEAFVFTQFSGEP
jgi:hypothetical protein